MSFSYLIQSIFETVAVAFVIWGLFHEDKMVAFENRIFSNIKRKQLKLVTQSPDKNIIDFDLR